MNEQMQKLKEKIIANKKIILVVLGILIMIILFILLMLGVLKNENKKEFESGSHDIYNKVSVDEAEQLYDDVTKDCTGALVFDLKPGENVKIDNMNDYTTACKSDNYYSKMIGYTYDLDGNVVIHVNILKKEENTLKKLNDDVVGEYSSDTINEMLNMGTTYEYIYTGNDGNYTLSDVRLMS